MVLLGENAVELTYSMLNILVSLVVARGTSETGFLPFNPVSIRRLRQAIDEATEPGTGAELIETGCGQEYRLAIPVAGIAVCDGFLELTRTKVLSEEDAKHLQRLCSRL